MATAISLVSNPLSLGSIHHDSCLSSSPVLSASSVSESGSDSVRSSSPDSLPDTLDVVLTDIDITTPTCISVPEKSLSSSLLEVVFEKHSSGRFLGLCIGKPASDTEWSKVCESNVEYYVSDGAFQVNCSMVIPVIIIASRIVLSISCVAGSPTQPKTSFGLCSGRSPPSCLFFIRRLRLLHPRATHSCLPSLVLYTVIPTRRVECDT